MKFFLLATLLTAFIFSSLSPGYGQIRTEDDSINQTDTRPVIILTGKLHETTFDVMEIDTLREEEEDALFIIGGALRFNYFVKTWEGEEDNRNKWGDLTFDLFRINVMGEYEGIILNAEYRFYSDAFGGPMPHSTKRFGNRE